MGKKSKRQGETQEGKGLGSCWGGHEGRGRREEALSPAPRWRVPGLGATLNHTWILEGPLAFLKPTRVCSPDVTTMGYRTLPFIPAGALQTAGVHRPVSGSRRCHCLSEAPQIG